VEAPPLVVEASTSDLTHFSNNNNYSESIYESVLLFTVGKERFFLSVDRNLDTFDTDLE
jgi:hypothetical protein